MSLPAPTVSGMNRLANLDRLLLLPEVADHTRTTVGTVRHWIGTGRLASIKPGRRRMVRLRDLESFLGESSDVPAEADGER
jgi:excisionase family DNA binding protein